MKGEPDWIIDHMLHRKREELVTRWKDREAKLARIRAKEKSTESRDNKRRKIGEATSRTKDGTTDEEAAYLLDEWNEDSSAGDDDPMSLFSKETRALMEKVGLGVSKKEAEDDEPPAEELKVNLLSTPIIIWKFPRAYACRFFIRREPIPSFLSSFPSFVDPRSLPL